MKWTIFAPVICVSVLLASCEDVSFVVQTGTFASSGTVVVWVQWDGQGVPDKRVELVELQQVTTTNDEGLAEFVVPIGDYTLRAYEINRGGPSLHYIDQKITITSNDEIRVDVVDCLPCV